MCEDGFFALIAAITARARADAAGPTSCAYQERGKWQRDAIVFLATLEDQRAELEDLARAAAYGDMPHRSPYRGRLRWEMSGDMQEAERVRNYLRRKKERT